MNKLITTLLILMIAASSAFATKTPKKIISAESVEVYTTDDSAIFESATFDAVKENLNFMTTTSISMIRIYSEEGTLEFQLPVMSQDVKINKNLFGEGKYKLGFMLQGQSKEVFTKVTIK